MPLRLEDLALAAWVAIASPVLVKVGASKGPFEPDQPVYGLLELAAVGAVVVCLAARRQKDQGTASSTLTSRGALGPFVGGLLLLTIGGFIAVDASSQAVLAVLAVTAIGAIVLRFTVPPLPLVIRRALVVPYVAIAAGLYWTVIEAVIGTQGFVDLRHSAAQNLRAAEPVLLFLGAFSAVYYAMLIYAPRQIAEREGRPLEWLLRYAAFVVSIVLGIGWLAALTT